MQYMKVYTYFDGLVEWHIETTVDLFEGDSVK